MIKAILVDDEPLARSMLIEYLENYPEVEVVAECDDGFEGVKAIMQHQPDVVFLDIQMPKINGFELLEIIDDRPAIVLTTAFDEYAIRAFEQQAVDYLLKPISKMRFDDTMNESLRRSSPEADKDTKARVNDSVHKSILGRVIVNTGNTIRIKPVEDIIF